MGFSLKVLQPASLAALFLIHSLQPADLLDIDSFSGLAMEDFSLAVIGFGRLGKAALLDSYRVGCFEGSAFKARIFDANANYLS